MQALISGIAAVVAHAKIVNPIRKFSLCRDPEDNMILDCCYAAKAKILITGDRDLIEITGLPFSIKFMTPQAFVEVED